ncbi:MAG: enoyl-CoA hydratase/isomerase family protein [Chloroflexi bacterium]|nr:enoyl-CoA hydratase/isomerase family protein [Chloroflexota bacterium]
MTMIRQRRRIDLRSPRVLTETSRAMGQWANQQLSWWHRQREEPATDTTEPDSVVLTVEEHVASVMLNRPERRNALNLASWRALADVAGRITTNASIRVVVLTGAGDRAFSAGSDIAEFPEARLGVQAARRYNETYEAALAAWAKIPQPVVASISGYCLGAGLELALTADFRLASDDAVFGIPAAKLGIGISVADARRLIDVVGPARARALLLSGERLSASQAQAIGLVDDVVPADELAGRVDAQVRTLLANAPRAMVWIKQVVDFAVRHPDVDTLPFDTLGTQVFASRDSAEGVAAFLAGRAPEFTGA